MKQVRVQPGEGASPAKALKAHMLRLVLEQRPCLAMMSTCNATSNAPMLSINTPIGFVRHKEIGTYQIRRGTLAMSLETRPNRSSAPITA